MRGECHKVSVVFRVNYGCSIQSVINLRVINRRCVSVALSVVYGKGVITVRCVLVHCGQYRG